MDLGILCNLTFMCFSPFYGFWSVLMSLTWFAQYSADHRSRRDMPLYFFVFEVNEFLCYKNVFVQKDYIIDGVRIFLKKLETKWEHVLRIRKSMLNYLNIYQLVEFKIHRGIQ